MLLFRANSRSSTAFASRAVLGRIWLYVWVRHAWKMTKSWPLYPDKIINFSAFLSKNGKKHESRYFLRFFGSFCQVLQNLAKLTKNLQRDADLFCFYMLGQA